ncbi:UbiH/UbiF/VisC/COQ6 family ubiquinone biosynthesis hydroxylase [Pseudomaricurvus sp. HS19]|uniref:UbiH/UbiF/VisC/COQ6 family ubiquinone biosynthesis hydroxylase n=1 Tax=Pseudomaricurvus sp. HS19 TaxID=2692626 RepID=UPI001F3E4FD7|nr:UbiH/UbiF/VisC/COQ6 family ubiquinone biosynthesis hydroxylase [Pseudomaricurvus sp. HS19]
MTTERQTLTYDIVVVGAGMVGSAIACALAADPRGADLRIAVVEAGADPAQFSGTDFDPRVVALTHASRDLLDSVGAWSLIEAERACPYRHMVVWDAEGTGSIDFHAAEVQQANLGHIVENSVVTRALLGCLRALPQIELLQPARVETLLRDEENGQPQVLLADGRVLTSSLLLAADGANSRVRQLANMATREWSYGQQAIVTTVRTERSHDDTAWQRFLASGPLAFLPMQTATAEGVDSHHCSIVWSLNDDCVESLMALDDEAFAAQLGEAFEMKLGAITQVDRRFCFPLRQRHAVDYVQRGIALMGDAAHTIHPLAGQGVNLGFLDVCAMRDEILRACERGVPLSDPSVLNRYQRSRKSHNLSMMGLMEGFQRLFGADNLGVRWLRNAGMRQVNRLGPLKNRLVRQAMGL